MLVYDLRDPLQRRCAAESIAVALDRDLPEPTELRYRENGREKVVWVYPTVMKSSTMTVWKADDLEGLVDKSGAAVNLDAWTEALIYQKAETYLKFRPRPLTFRENIEAARRLPKEAYREPVLKNYYVRTQEVGKILQDGRADVRRLLGVDFTYEDLNLPEQVVSQQKRKLADWQPKVVGKAEIPRFILSDTLQTSIAREIGDLTSFEGCVPVDDDIRSARNASPQEFTIEWGGIQPDSEGWFTVILHELSEEKRLLHAYAKGLLEGGERVALSICSDEPPKK